MASGSPRLGLGGRAGVDAGGAASPALRGAACPRSWHRRRIIYGFVSVPLILELFQLPLPSPHIAFPRKPIAQDGMQLLAGLSLSPASLAVSPLGGLAVTGLCHRPGCFLLLLRDAPVLNSIPTAWEPTEDTREPWERGQPRTRLQGVNLRCQIAF